MSAPSPMMAQLLVSTMALCTMTIAFGHLSRPDSSSRLPTQSTLDDVKQLLNQLEEELNGLKEKAHNRGINYDIIAAHQNVKEPSRLLQDIDLLRVRYRELQLEYDETGEPRSGWFGFLSTGETILDRARRLLETCNDVKVDVTKSTSSVQSETLGLEEDEGGMRAKHICLDSSLIGHLDEATYEKIWGIDTSVPQKITDSMLSIATDALEHLPVDDDGAIDTFPVPPNLTAMPPLAPPMRHSTLLQRHLTEQSQAIAEATKKMDAMLLTRQLRNPRRTATMIPAPSPP